MALTVSSRSSRKARDGTLDVRPGRVLRQDGADDDFETRPAGPPVLRAVSRKERIVVGVENGLCREREQTETLRRSGPKGARPKLIRELAEEKE